MWVNVSNDPEEHGKEEKRMKKRISILLAAVLIGLGCIPSALPVRAAAEELFEEDGEDTLYTGPAYEYDHLVVGNPTPLSGNFTTQMWGYNTSDVDITALVNACNLVCWDYGASNFQTDPTAVSGLTVMDDVEGDRTYLLAIQRDLVYSDGTPITAEDYAFSILLSICPEVRELGGDTENYSWIPGVAEYRAGSAKALSGVHILPGNILAVTVSHEWLPFFYELGLLWCYPMPVHVIAPGCSVRETEDGVRIEGSFTAEMLRKTLLDPEEGYVSQPRVVSGPYLLVSYDRESATAEFTINSAYRGNREGVFPTIRKLTVIPVDNEHMTEELASGRVGLLNKVTRIDAITQGIALAGSGNYAMTAYPRTGMSFISFNCEKETVSDRAVRQAAALCLDKDAVVERYTGGYGIRVDGYYGIGQWMYQALAGTLPYPGEKPEEGTEEAGKYAEEAEAWDALDLGLIPRYELDPERAAEILEAAGWNLNEQGEPFDPARDAVRCRETDGRRTALRLRAVYPAGSMLGEILRETFVPYLAQAGILLELEGMEWEQLLRQYYRQEARDCDLMVLGSNFSEVFDPRNTFDPEDAETGMNNYTGIRDEELYRLAGEMSRTEPGDYLGYLRRWIAFQERFQEEVPMISLYGNAYFDFYTRYLKDYRVGSEVTWTQAVVPAYMSDPGDAE